MIIFVVFIYKTAKPRHWYGPPLTIVCKRDDKEYQMYLDKGFKAVSEGRRGTIVMELQEGHEVLMDG